MFDALTRAVAGRTRATQRLFDRHYLMPLFDLPNELLESILILCDPIDVARVSQSCRDFRNLVYRGPDDALWRSLYLAHLQLDDPRQCVAMDGQPRPPIKWKEELQRAIRVRTLVTTNSVGKPGEIGIILQTLLDLTTLVRPLALDSFPKSLSMSLVAIPAFLRHGWIDLVEREPLEERERQMVARFHTYYGLTQNDMRKESWIRSRSFVYNFRNYSVRNDFGPFFDNGTVNWVHARALHHVMSMQVLEQQGISNDPEEFEYALYPMSLPFTQIVVPAKDEHDWLDITGEWEVSFIFIDHRVLLRTCLLLVLTTSIADLIRLRLQRKHSKQTSETAIDISRSQGIRRCSQVSLHPCIRPYLKRKSSKRFSGR